MQRSNPTEESITRAIVTHLDAHTQDITLTQRMRLDEARARALAHAQAPARRPWLGMRASALLGASAAVLLAIGVHFWGMAEREREQEALLSMWETPTQNEASDALAPMDADVLADEDEAQVVDDLEFYAWLAEQQRVSGAPSGS